ncbi:hypothetical protein J3U68_07040 [Snodgrassella sp. B3882]|uniref:hypothetical protein n=1 Tax=Snodgrassella sp. B3882 TaxID=2818037 RepID=UPI002269D55A|nr:hypothetical protein [Snodgrassella sp. B3882]MCX8745160.1 hypothetical protein [Snodgrassella sp. B3882]
MKNFFLALFLSPIICFAQDHVSEFWKIDKWRTNKVINAQSTEFYLTNPEDNKKNTIYGNFIIFQKDGTFASKYYARCGNDCFPSSRGTFKKIDDNHIHLRINSFKQHGLTRGCPPIDDPTQRDLGIFKIEPTKEGYRLIKSPISSSNP